MSVQKNQFKFLNTAFLFVTIQIWIYIFFYTMTWQKRKEFEFDSSSGVLRQLFPKTNETHT